VHVGTAELPALAGVLAVPTAGGGVPLLARVVLPPDGRPPVVVLTELPGAPVPWTDGRFAGAAADQVVERFAEVREVPPDRVLWFADHAPHDGAAGLLRRLQVLRESGRSLADPRASEPLPPEAADWWRGVLRLRPAGEVLGGLTGGQRPASATASDWSR